MIINKYFSLLRSLTCFVLLTPVLVITQPQKTYNSSEIKLALKKLNGYERSFCRRCGSALWAWSPKWRELVHPFASALDTPLPTPPERTHLMLGSRAPWVEAHLDPGDKTFDHYPDESIAEWHQRLSVEDPS